MAQAVLDPQVRKYTRELPIATTEILALFKSNEVVTSIPYFCTSVPGLLLIRV